MGRSARRKEQRYAGTRQGKAGMEGVSACPLCSGHPKTDGIHPQSKPLVPGISHCPQILPGPHNPACPRAAAAYREEGHEAQVYRLEQYLVEHYGYKTEAG